MVNKIIELVMKLPLLIVVFGSLIASVYAAWNKIQGVGWATPVILACSIILYFLADTLRE